MDARGLNDLTDAVARLCSDLYTACMCRRGFCPERPIDPEQLREDMEFVGRMLLDAAGVSID
jgi:hypothetical protein